MTTQEFSNTFDTLLASYDVKAVFGDQASAANLVLDEYEKSLFLTQAQDIIIKQYFESSDKSVGYDGNERRQIDFGYLTTSFDISEDPRIFHEDDVYADGSHIFVMPTDVMYILNEKVYIDGSTSRMDTFVVKPIHYREYDRETSKVWSQPLKRQAWRLISKDMWDDNSDKAEIIITDAAEKKLSGGKELRYRIRYVRRPNPIILTNLKSSGLRIGNYSQVSQCELDPILHMDILNKAVELAYATRVGKSTSQQ